MSIAYLSILAKKKGFGVTQSDIDSKPKNSIIYALKQSRFANIF